MKIHFQKMISAKYVVPLLVVLVAIVIFTLEVCFAGSWTPREAILYNFIEFGISIYFGFLFSKITLEREFSEKMKYKAISAYRRIQEIGRNVTHLINYAELKKEEYKEAASDFDTIKEIATCTLETVRSSVGDWADIIGDDLKNLFESKILEEEKFKALIAKEKLAENSEEYVRLEKRIGEITANIDSLTKQLPVGFSAATATSKLSDFKNLGIDFSTSSPIMYGRIPTSITGEWRESPTSEFSIFDMKEGDELVIKKGNSQTEVFDLGNKQIGTIKYDDIMGLQRAGFTPYEQRVKIISFKSNSINNIELKCYTS